MRATQECSTSAAHKIQTEGQKMYQCQSCGKCFDTAKEWSTHKDDRHNEEEV